MDIIGGQHLRQMWDDLADVYGHKTALICESSSESLTGIVILS